MSWSNPIALNNGDPVTLVLSNQYWVDNPQFLYDNLGILDAKLGHTVLTSPGVFQFLSLSGSYDNLLIKGALRGVAAANTVGTIIRFNNDAGGNYQWTSTLASGSGDAAATSAAGTTQALADAASLNAGQFSPFEMTIYNYAAANRPKPYILTIAYLQQNASLSRINTISGIYNQNTPISQIDITPSSGTNWDIDSWVSIFPTQSIP